MEAHVFIVIRRAQRLEKHTAMDLNGADTGTLTCS
jgi:hypothetical protein